MPLRINNESFWEISAAFLLDSRFRFGDRPPSPNSYISQRMTCWSSEAGAKPPATRH